MLDSASCLLSEHSKYSELEVSFGREIAAVREAADDAEIQPSVGGARHRLGKISCVCQPCVLEVRFAMPGVKLKRLWHA